MHNSNRLSVIILNTEKHKERSILGSRSSCVPPELRVCERRLSCVIEGVEKDRLLVRFSRIDPSEIDREATFVIDLLNQMYKGESLTRSISSFVQRLQS